MKKKVEIVKIMEEAPPEKTARFKITFDGVGNWDSQSLDQAAVEFDLGEELDKEISFKIRFLGVKAYGILRKLLNCRFNISVILFDKEYNEIYKFQYISVVLEEVYGLQLSLIAESTTPNFIARFHSRKEEKKEFSGWHKTYGSGNKS
jgi:hypothetical protein